MYVGQIVGPHQPDETCPRKPLPQSLKRPVGRPCAQRPLDIGHHHPRVPGHGAGLADADRQRRHAVLGLQRVLRRYQPPDLIKAQPLERQKAGMPVPVMGRIEGTAEKADLPAGPGRAGAKMRRDRRQGRTCPLPRTTYL